MSFIAIVTHYLGKYNKAMSKTANIFGPRLKEARKAAGFTQQAAADAFGIQLRGYCRWEAGENEPSLVTLAAIARTFNVSVDYLLGLADEARAD